MTDSALPLPEWYSRRKPVDTKAIDRMVTMMAVNDEYLTRIKSLLADPRLFMNVSGFLPVVIRWILEFHNEYGGEAPRSYLRKVFEDKRTTINEAQADLIDRFLTRINEEYKAGDFKVVNLEYDLKQAERLIQKEANNNHQKDVALALERGDNDKVKELLANFKLPTLSIGEEMDSGGFTLAQLKELDMPEVKWTIDGLIPPGLTLFAGKPKVGKSTFFFNLAVDLTRGLPIFRAVDCEQTEILYLAGESTKKELKEQCFNLLDEKDDWPDKWLHIFPIGHWPMFDQGGWEKLEKWLLEHPNTGLIVIDTWTKFKPPQKGTNSNYELEYKMFDRLHQIAALNEVSIVALWHTKKTEEKDPFNNPYGGYGQQAAADTIAVFEHGGGASRKLTLRGRDPVGNPEPLAFTLVGGLYVFEGGARFFDKSIASQAIIGFVAAAGRDVTTKEIKDDPYVKENTGSGIEATIRRLCDKEDLERVSRGVYRIGPNYDERSVKMITNEQAARLVRSARRRLNKKRR